MTQHTNLERVRYGIEFQFQDEQTTQRWSVGDQKQFEGDLAVLLSPETPDAESKTLEVLRFARVRTLRSKLYHVHSIIGNALSALKGNDEVHTSQGFFEQAEQQNDPKKIPGREESGWIPLSLGLHDAKVAYADATLGERYPTVAAKQRFETAIAKAKLFVATEVNGVDMADVIGDPSADKLDADGQS